MARISFATKWWNISSERMYSLEKNGFIIFKREVHDFFNPLNIHFQLFLFLYLLTSAADSLYLRNEMIMVNRATIGISTNISFIGRKCWNVFLVFCTAFYAFLIVNPNTQSQCLLITLFNMINIVAIITKTNTLNLWKKIKKKSEICNMLRVTEYILCFIKNEKEGRRVRHSEFGANILRWNLSLSCKESISSLR